LAGAAQHAALDAVKDRGQPEELERDVEIPMGMPARPVRAQ
jgi:hypothetical protein